MIRDPWEGKLDDLQNANQMSGGPKAQGPRWVKVLIGAVFFALLIGACLWLACQ